MASLIRASMMALGAALSAFFAGCSYDTGGAPAPASPQETASQPQPAPQTPTGDGGRRTARVAGALGIAAPSDPPPRPQAAPPTSASPRVSVPATVPPPRREGTILTERTSEVVDFAQAQAAGYRPVPGQEGVDVLTQLGTVGVRVGSFVGSIPLKRWLQEHKALNGRYPTFAEVTEWIAQNNYELPARYGYERYAYDESTGQFIVVEHPDLKTQYMRDRGVQ